MFQRRGSRCERGFSRRRLFLSGGLAAVNTHRISTDCFSRSSVAWRSPWAISFVPTGASDQALVKILLAPARGTHFMRFGCLFKAANLACLGGAFGKPVWPFFVHAFVRNPYKIVYGFRTQFLYGLRSRKFARAIFFLRRPDFRVQNPTQIFGTDSDPDFCTDSVHKATECEPARTGATWAVRTPCTDSVHIFGRFLNQILGFGIRGKPFCQI